MKLVVTLQILCLILNLQKSYQVTFPPDLTSIILNNQDLQLTDLPTHKTLVAFRTRGEFVKGMHLNVPATEGYYMSYGINIIKEASSTQATIVLPPVTLASYGTLTGDLLFRVVIMSVTKHKFTYQVFPPGVILTGPDELPAQSATIPHKVVSTINYVADFGKDESNFGTTLVSFMLKLKNDIVLKNADCKLRFHFKGSFYAYIDSLFIGMASSRIASLESYYIIERPLRFQKHQFRYVQLFGQKLHLLGIDLVECQTNSIDVPIKVDFNHYATELEGQSDNVEYPQQFFSSCQTYPCKFCQKRDVYECTQCPDGEALIPDDNSGAKCVDINNLSHQFINYINYPTFNFQQRIGSRAPLYTDMIDSITVSQQNDIVLSTSMPSLPPQEYLLVLSFGIPFWHDGTIHMVPVANKNFQMRQVLKTNEDISQIEIPYSSAPSMGTIFMMRFHNSFLSSTTKIAYSTTGSFDKNRKAEGDSVNWQRSSNGQISMTNGIRQYVVLHLYRNPNADSFITMNVPTSSAPPTKINGFNLDSDFTFNTNTFVISFLKDEISDAFILLVMDITPDSTANFRIDAVSNFFFITQTPQITFEFTFCPGGQSFSEETLACEITAQCKDTLFKQGVRCQKVCNDVTANNDCLIVPDSTGLNVKLAENIDMSAEQPVFILGAKDTERYVVQHIREETNLQYGFLTVKENVDTVNMSPARLSPEGISGNLGMMLSKINYASNSQAGGIILQTVEYDKWLVVPFWNSFEGIFQKVSGTTFNPSIVHTTEKLEYEGSILANPVEDFKGFAFLTYLQYIPKNDDHNTLTCNLGLKFRGGVYVYVDGSFLGSASSVIYSEFEDYVNIFEGELEVTKDNLLTIQIFGIHVEIFYVGYTNCKYQGTSVDYVPKTKIWGPVNGKSQEMPYNPFSANCEAQNALLADCKDAISCSFLQCKVCDTAKIVFFNGNCRNKDSKTNLFHFQAEFQKSFRSQRFHKPQFSFIFDFDNQGSLKVLDQLSPFYKPQLRLIFPKGATNPLPMIFVPNSFTDKVIIQEITSQTFEIVNYNGLLEDGKPVTDIFIKANENLQYKNTDFCLIIQRFPGATQPTVNDMKTMQGEMICNNEFISTNDWVIATGILKGTLIISFIRSNLDDVFVYLNGNQITLQDHTSEQEFIVLDPYSFLIIIFKSSTSGRLFIGGKNTVESIDVERLDTKLITNKCLFDVQKKKFNPQTGECLAQCPEGMNANGNECYECGLFCTETPEKYIEIKSKENLEPCKNGLQYEAILVKTPNTGFKWGIEVTNSTEPNKKAQIIDFVSKKTALSITLPQQLLEPWAKYVLIAQNTDDEREQFSIPSPILSILDTSSDTCTTVLPLEFTIECINCPSSKYSQNFDYTFKPKLPNGITLDPTQTTYKWTLIPNFVHNVVSDTLVISDNQEVHLEDELQVTLQIINPIQQGSASLTPPLVINKPPKNGVIECAPTTGLALDTDFTISTKNWDKFKDYRFYYSQTVTGEREWTSLGSKQTDSSITVKLPSGYNPNFDIHLRVIVYDNDGLTSERQMTIKVNNPDNGVTQTVQNIGNQLNSLSNDPETALQELNVLINQINALESNIISENSINNPCTTCKPGQGECKNNKCICVSGFALPDCSLKVEDLVKILQAKEKLLDNLEQQLNKDNSESNQELALETLESLSNKQEFMNDHIASKINQILKEKIELDKTGKLLSKDSSSSASQIVDNLMQYLQQNCGQNQGLHQDIGDKIDDYLDNIADSLLTHQAIGEKPAILSEELFSIYASKQQLCNLPDQTITIDDQSPEITLKPKDQNQQLSCDQVANLNYYTFKQDIFKCSDQANSLQNIKPNISISITDQNTGENLDHLFTMEVKMPAGLPCPDGCIRQASGICECENLSLFDPKKQFLKIFAEAQFAQLTNWQAILHWKFWNDFAFWCVTGLTIFFILSIPFNLYKLKDFSVLPHNGQKARHKGMISLIVLNPILSIYLIETKETSKNTRASMFYLRALGMMTFASIFGTTGEFEGFSGYFTDINPYLFVLPFFTVIPINLLYEYLMQSTEIRARSGTPMSTFLKVKRISGFIFGAIGTLAFIFAICVLAANKTPSQNKAWRYDFILTMIQDNIIFPFILLLLQLFLLNLAKRNTNELARTGVKGFISKQFVNSSIAALYLDQSKFKPTSASTFPTKKNKIKSLKNQRVSKIKVTKSYSGNEKSELGSSPQKMVTTTDQSPTKSFKKFANFSFQDLLDRHEQIKKNPKIENKISLSHQQNISQNSIHDAINSPLKKIIPDEESKNNIKNKDEEGDFQILKNLSKQRKPSSYQAVEQPKPLKPRQLLKNRSQSIGQVQNDVDLQQYTMSVTQGVKSQDLVNENDNDNQLRKKVRRTKSNLSSKKTKSNQ